MVKRITSNDEILGSIPSRGNSRFNSEPKQLKEFHFLLLTNSIYLSLSLLMVPSISLGHKSDT